MEITSIYSFIIAIVVIASLRWAWRFLSWVWITPKKLEKCLRRQGFNGNSYKLFVGDLNENSDLIREANSTPINFSNDIVPRVLPFLHKSINRYGNSSFMWFGPIPRLYITDLELIKVIFSKHNDFQKPMPSPLSKKLLSGLGSLEGDRWAKHRKIINPAFHSEKLKLMLPAFCISTRLMLKEWEQSVPEGETCEVDVWPSIENLTSDAISRTAFGSSYEEGEKIFKLLKELIIISMQAFRSHWIPGWRFLPTKTNKALMNIKKEIQLLVEGIINKREKAMNIGDAAADDLLGLLLDSNLQEKEHGNVGLSIQEVLEECKLFYFAGQETTSDLLVWTMIMLSKHQEWQKLARDEVWRVFGNEKPNVNGLNHLKIVTMILNEVLRLYPPAVDFTRVVYKDIKLGNLCIPAGVQISLPTIHMHRDKIEWGPDALEFNPGRFSGGVSKASKSQLAFLPFGWGPRICIGNNFAMMEAKTAIVMILQSFSFEISPSYAHAPMTIMTLKPQFGAHLMLRKL